MRCSFVVWLVGGLVASLGAAWVPVAQAQVDDGAVEAEFSAEEAATLESAARTLFEAGRTAYTEARFEDALDRFQRAYTISERSLLLYNIAQTQERLRRDAEAITTFERFLETDAPDDIRAIAERRLARLRAATIAPPPEEVAASAVAEDAEPAPSSNIGPIVAVTVAAIVVVFTAILVAVMVTKKDDRVQGTIGDVIRTLRTQ